MSKNWKSEREKKMKKINKSIESIGKGLYRPQVEVNIAPWVNTIYGHGQATGCQTEYRDSDNQ